MMFNYLILEKGLQNYFFHFSSNIFFCQLNKIPCEQLIKLII